VSRREFKRDIHELDRAEIERIYSELRDVKLTTYQYKTDPEASPRRLGFIIDDTKSPYPINADGTSVNLYGYMSMAVAAIQSQSREIEALRAEVARLKRARACRSPKPDRGEEWTGMARGKRDPLAFRIPTYACVSRRERVRSLARGPLA